MGIRIRSHVEADFARFLQAKENRMYASLAASMIVIMHDAEWEMKGLSAGRIDTGAMLEAFGSKIDFHARKIVAEAGFVDEKQDYYIYQTVTGFTHWLSGQRVEPTGAIAEAGTKAYYSTLEAIADAIKSAS